MQNKLPVKHWRRGAGIVAILFFAAASACSSATDEEVTEPATPEVTETTPMHILPGSDAKAMLDRVHAAGDKLEQRERELDEVIGQ